ncbi:MAG TPA: TIGR02996 domain-containing protein [Kofleriaceae bacterium]
MGRAKSLDAALAALRADRDDVRGVLRHVLVAWREQPGASELADLIDRAPCPEVPEVAGARKAPRAAWLARAERRDPLDIPALLATWLDAGAPVARARLEVLLDGPRDCRIEHALAANLANVPRTSEGTLPMWRRVFDAAVTFRDPRAWQLLRDARPQGGLKMQDFMRRRLAKLVPPVELARELSEREREIVHEIARAWQAPRTAPQTRAAADALLCAVFDDPADDNTRLVYADALLQRGDDPHGELIVLQIERARGTTSAPRRARERAILDEHFPRVVGPLAGVVRPTNAKVERGFLASAKLAPEERQLAGDPWWATVRALDGGHPDLVTHAAMRSLESVVAYTPAHVAAVAKAAPPTLRSLACAFTAHDVNPGAWHGALAAVGESVAPLSRVEIRGWEWASWRPMPDDYRSLLESARGQHLTSLHAYAPNYRWGYVADPSAVAIGAWLRVFRRYALPARLVLDDGHDAFAFEDGKLVEIVCRWQRDELADPSGLIEWAVAGARSLAHDELGDDVAIRFTAGKAPPSTLATIRDALSAARASPSRS